MLVKRMSLGLGWVWAAEFGLNVCVIKENTDAGVRHWDRGC